MLQNTKQPRVKEVSKRDKNTVPEKSRRYPLEVQCEFSQLSLKRQNDLNLYRLDLNV